MTYSKFHKDKNPFSPARLDEAFKASKIEGGPGDPVKITIEKNVEAGEVTVTKSSRGKKPELTPEQKKERNERWANMSEEQKQAARERAEERRALESFTYRKLKPVDHKLELIDEDIDISLAPPPEDYLTSETPTTSFTYTTSETKKKKNKDKPDDPKIPGDGLSKTCVDDPTACVAPIGDQSKKALKAAERKRKIEIKASKKRDRQIERGTFDPKQWFQNKMEQRTRNKAIKEVKKKRAKRTKRINKEYKKSLKNKPIKNFFDDLSENKKVKSRTIKADF